MRRVWRLLVPVVAENRGLISDVGVRNGNISGTGEAWIRSFSVTVD